VAGQAGWQYADMSQVHRPLAWAALCALATGRGPTARADLAGADLARADFAAPAQAMAAVGEYVQTAVPVGRK
jgi:hypothetical protein